MAKYPQWNVKGVDEATRLIARDAARLAGLPIGSWIDRAIKLSARAESAAAPIEPRPLPLFGPADAISEMDMPTAPIEQPHRSSRGLRIGLALAAVVVLAAGTTFLWFKPLQTPSTIQSAAAPQAVVPATTTESPSLQALRQAAQAGDARAQYDIGMRYASGREVQRDEAQAAVWFERAALQGLATAQYNLAVLYDLGVGVQQDDALAFRWYRSAAEQGHPRAEHNLAIAYVDGKGTGKDLTQAATWLEKAAEAGLPESQFYLAIMFERGLGVEPDPERAIALFRRAAERGHKEAAAKIEALDAAPAAQAATRQSTDETAPARKEGPVSRRTIAEIQRLLARLDFAPGTADGVLGRKTVQAISAYQGMAGITVDGKPSAALLDELREVARITKP